MDGDHTLGRCAAVTAEVMQAVFDQLDEQKMLLEGMLLKPNMILPGLAAADQSSIDAVAEATVTWLLRKVPAAVPGIAFLSGRQSAGLTSARLNAMNRALPLAPAVGALTFSFARHPAAGARGVAWHGRERPRGTAGALLPGQLQPCGAATMTPPATRRVRSDH